jgi:hypothetical protein
MSREPYYAAIDKTINAHTPNLTGKAESIMDARMRGPEEWDWAEYAVRECSCNRIVDGFYGYIEHLREEMVNQIIDASLVSGT